MQPATRWSAAPPQRCLFDPSLSSSMTRPSGAAGFYGAGWPFFLVPMAVVKIKSKAQSSASSPDDVHDLRDLLPGGSTQLVAGLVNLGPVFLSDFGDLRLLLVRQVQVGEVRDPVSPAITDALFALFLQLREFFLLLRGEDGFDLLQFIPHDRHQLFADGFDFRLLFVVEIEGFPDFSAALPCF